MVKKKKIRTRTKNSDLPNRLPNNSKEREKYWKNFNPERKIIEDDE